MTQSLPPLGMYDVVLVLNETGETKTFRYEYPLDESSHFLWTEGNYECDCNRRVFFFGHDKESERWPCGSGRISAIKAILPSGEEVVLDEGDGG